MAELSQACAQAHPRCGEGRPRGQAQGLWRWEPREAEAGPEVPQLLLQLMQPPQRICLHLAPAAALLNAQLGGQGQAAGGGRNLLLHRHLPLQGLESQLLRGREGTEVGASRAQDRAGDRDPAAAEEGPILR